MEGKKRTEIAELGQVGLIDRLAGKFTARDASTLVGIGDDAAVIAPPAGETMLCTTDTFFEGVDFDLTYFPLKHLGYKVVTAGISDILAMNALPSQITVSLGVSAKLPFEALDDLYEGIAFACREQEIDLVGGDTRASMTGLVISVTALGHAKKDTVVRRSGAQQNDLICITGNLGAAYMGLRLLERERRVLNDVRDPQPQLAGYEYLLEKYLKPRPRTDIVVTLGEEKIRPTSMIDLSDGLASDLMQLCKA
ncbi:MAG: thiamine-phosphate kinase, partial [Alistipes sp.]|nr:thiamine-phosphate kinase [Alistipes sp.]